MRRCTLLLALPLLLAACATPYQPRGLSGGFSETRLDTNTFRVAFQGNGFTSRERVEVYLLRRAAELTLEHGADYFVVVDEGTERNILSVTTPGRYSATTTASAYAVGSTAYGSATTVGTYTPGVTVPITKYGAGATIKVFRGEKPADLANGYDARDVLQYVGGPSRPRQESQPSRAPVPARAPALAAAPATGSSAPVAATAPIGFPAPLDVTQSAGVTRQDQEEGRAAIARAQAEAYRRLDQVQVAQAPPAPTLPGTLTPAPSRAEPWFRGTSGPVAWEITAIERRMNGRQTSIRWDYELVLRETAGVRIRFETLEIGAQGRVRDTSTPMRFDRRLEPSGELRITRSYWIRFASETPTGFGAVPGGREGISVFHRFEGKADTGRSVRVDVHVPLSPSTGIEAVSSQPPAVSGSPRTLASGELASLAGGWVGVFEDDQGFSFPAELILKPDGGFDGVTGGVVKQRFRGALGLTPSGGILYSTQVAGGSVSLHEEQNRRVLIGNAVRRPEAPQGTASYSFRLEARAQGAAPAPPVAVATLPTPPGPTAPTPAVAPGVPPSSTESEVLTNESILSMVKAGLDETVILAKITATPARFDTRTDALIELKRAGVPDRVLAAMVEKRIL